MGSEVETYLAGRVERLKTLVAASLGGAQLRNWHLTESTDTESIYVVVSRKPDGEWCTHRACLSVYTDEAMLVWGHYFHPAADPNACQSAYRDFLERTRAGV